MKRLTLVFFSLVWVLPACTATKRLIGPTYDMRDVNASLAVRDYDQAAARLDRCAGQHGNADKDLCAQRLSALRATGKSARDALRAQGNAEDDRKTQGKEKEEMAVLVARLRASESPWDKYILFSHLSAGIAVPIDPEEPSRVANEAFAGFGECAKKTEPSCMGMYGELIIRGSTSLNLNSETDARRKGLYWLNLAARYGYEPARRVLVAEGENIPTPDLAMEQLQREANSIAKDSAINQERMRMQQAARDYEIIRETRLQTEQMMWSSLFPKMVSCNSSAVGSYVYTTCR